VKLHFANVPQFCASIKLTEEKPLIDLTALDFIEPSALVYLGVFLRHFNSAGKYFRVNPPTDHKVRKYLADQHFWDRFNFAPAIIVREDQLRTFTPSTSPGDILDIEKSEDIAERVAMEVFRILEFHPHANRIGEIVSELVDNFAVHSRGPLAVFAMQWYPRAKRAVLAIDYGLHPENSAEMR
jgi:hypothetical protein